MGLGRCIGNFHQLLPEILAGKEPHERSWGMLEADRDVLLLDEFAFAMPAAKCLEGLGLTQGIINPAESHDPPAPRHQIGVIRRARQWHGGVVDGDRTAQRDPCIEVDAGEYLVKDGAPNVVEEDVDPVGTKRRKSSAEVLALVVDSGVEVPFVDEPFALFLAARRTDNAAALIFAIWPAIEPVAPAAPDTTTVSPALTWPTSVIPKYAVRPLMPNRLNARLGGTPGGTLCIPPKALPSVAT